MPNNEDKYKPIVIKDLATRVSPALGKLIPSFLYKRFEKILHIPEFNEHFEKYHNATASQFLDATVSRLNIGDEFEGQGLSEFEKYNDTGVIVASNHPYGGPEAIVLMKYLVKIIPGIKMVSQSFLKFVKPLGECCVFNKKDVRTLMDHVKDHKSFLIYPAGYCSRELSFKDVFDYDWKPSFVKLAKKNNMPIIIVFTDGRVSKKMLNWTKFRNFFHIKASIETIYLPQQLFLLDGKKIRMVVSKAISPEVFTDDVDNSEWAARLRQYCYELKTNPTAEFDPKKPATLPLK